MSRKSIWIRTGQAALVAALISPLMSACAVVDQFGSRAVDYNDQAAVTKSSMILLNILRAAYSEPLQFSDMTTVAGTTSIGGTATATIPTYLNTAAALAARSASLSPSATATGSATVNVANLNTQEFYQGLQTPLTMQQIAYYMLNAPNGLSASQLLPLFIADIEISSTDETKKAVLRNSGRSPDAFFAFYSALNAMIINGLNVEPTGKKPAERIGPLLTTEEAKDPKFLAAVIAAASANAGAASGASGLTLAAIKEKSSGTTGYQLQKDAGGGGYRFCFSNSARPYADVDFTIFTRPKFDPMVIPLGMADGAPVPAVSVRIGSAYYCGAKSPPAAKPNGPHHVAGEGIKITTRSLEGIFFYLGEIVRTELGLSTGEGVPLVIPGEGHDDLRFFNVERRPPGFGEPWVTHNGSTFSIPVDPSGRRNTSSRIVQLVGDLMALQSSAKNLPAPNLIAITTQ